MARTKEPAAVVKSVAKFDWSALSTDGATVSFA